jgi:hypothetical protein
MNVKTRIASVGVAGALLLGGAAAPAQAAGPLVTGGLVNVTLTNVLNDNQVQIAVPIQAAAAICGVTVNLLSAELAPTGTQTFNCPASNGNQTVTASR